MLNKLIKFVSGKPPVLSGGFGKGGRSGCTHINDSSDSAETGQNTENRRDKKFISSLVNKRTIQGREHRSSSPFSEREVENMNIRYLLDDIKQENTLTPKVIELLEFICEKVVK